MNELPEQISRGLFATGVYMVIGAVLILLIGRKRKDIDLGRLWTKYFVYLVLICAMYGCLLAGWGKWSSVVILALGFFELVRVTFSGEKKPRPLQAIAAFVIYFVFATGFFLFSLSSFTLLAEVYTCVIVFDGFSQLSGQLFGRLRLAPKVSPGKTVEGFVGGTVMLIVTIGWIEQPVWWIAMTAGVVAGLAALSGDLLASKYKRICGVKDYSPLIPGHGGVLDRFDSFIAVGALCMGYFVVNVLLFGIG